MLTTTFATLSTSEIYNLIDWVQTSNKNSECEPLDNSKGKYIQKETTFALKEITSEF